MKTKKVEVELPITEYEGELYEPTGEYRALKEGDVYLLDDGKYDLWESASISVATRHIYKKVQKPNKLDEIMNRSVYSYEECLKEVSIQLKALNKRLDKNEQGDSA